MKVKLLDELIRGFKVTRVFQQDTDTIVKSMDFSLDGEQLISSNEDQISVYNCELGLQTGLIPTKKYGANLIRFTRDNCTAIHSSTKVDDNIRYLNVNNNCYFRYFAGHAKKVVSLSVAPTKDTFLSASLDKTLRLWDLRLPDSQGVLHFSERLTAAYDPDGIIFAVGLNSTGCVKLYDSRVFGKGPFATFKLNCDKKCQCTALKFSGDGKTILVNTNGSAALLVDAFNGTHMQTLAGETI